MEMERDTWNRKLDKYMGRKQHHRVQEGIRENCLGVTRGRNRNKSYNKRNKNKITQEPNKTKAEYWKTKNQWRDKKFKRKTTNQNINTCAKIKKKKRRKKKGNIEKMKQKPRVRNI